MRLTKFTMLLTVATLATLALQACSSSSNDPVNAGNVDPDAATLDNMSGMDNMMVVTSTPPANSPTEQSARYRVTFTADWSSASHPQNFPGNPHFSGLVGAVHNEQVIFWEPGQIATDGVRIVAETGGKTDIRPEINAAIDAGYAELLIDEGGVAESPGSVSFEVDVNRQYPQITVLTMLAPSPDWFAGVHNLNLLDVDTFLSVVRLPLALYDAGTDSGTSYTSANLSTDPRSPISLVSSDSADSPFVNGLPYIGELLIEKISAQ